MGPPVPVREPAQDRTDAASHDGVGKVGTGQGEDERSQQQEGHPSFSSLHCRNSCTYVRCSSRLEANLVSPVSRFTVTK